METFLLQWLAGQGLRATGSLILRVLKPSEAERVVKRTTGLLRDRLPAGPGAKDLANAVEERLAARTVRAERLAGLDETAARRVLAEHLEPVLALQFDRPDGSRVTGDEVLTGLGLDLVGLAEVVAETSDQALREVAATVGGLPEKLRQRDAAWERQVLQRIESTLTLPRPAVPEPVDGWVMVGAGLQDAREHFQMRAQGQRNRARGGDLFKGRFAARKRVQEVLLAVEAPGRPLVVTGRPGSGKSAVVARAALDLGTTSGSAAADLATSPGLAFHAKGANLEHFLASVAVLVPEVSEKSGAQLSDLVDALAATPDRGVRVVVDALDEAASDQDRREIAQAIVELAAVPSVRIAVASRPLTAGDNPCAPDGVLSRLGIREPNSPMLVDLDAPAYRDPEAVRAFAAAVLAQDRVRHPGPRGAAWEKYRQDHGLCARLARVIADRAGGNFLVAALAAVHLSEASGVVDPASPGFDPAQIPSGIGEALDKHWEQLPPPRRETERRLLTALAYAQGPGLDDDTWLVFAQALGRSDVTITDLDVLRHSASADYLLETLPPGTDGRGPVTRLFHQALADQLLADRNTRQSSDQNRIVDALLAHAAGHGWSGYGLDYAAHHAAAAHRLDELLDDLDYLLAVDPPHLLPYLNAAQGDKARLTASTYRQTAHVLTTPHRDVRASQLELTAHRLGHHHLADHITQTTPHRPWKTTWSHGKKTTDHLILTGHTGGVVAVATGTLSDGTPVAVSGDGDGTVRVWRLDDGTAYGEPLTGHADPVVAVATGTLSDGTPVAVTGDGEGTVRVWRLDDGTAYGEPLTGHTGPVGAVATGTLSDGTPVAVTGDGDGTVRVWRLDSCVAVPPPLVLPGPALVAVAGNLIITGCGSDLAVHQHHLMLEAPESR